MKFFFFAIFAASMAFGQKITIEFDKSADFSRYHTFTLAGGQLNSRNPELNSELVRKELDDSLARYLTAKGLTEVLNNGDLTVGYHFGSARKKTVQHYPAGTLGRRTRTVRVPYTEGTLVIDFNDTAMHDLVWRAIAHEDKNRPDQIAGKLDEMVKKSIAKYPPKVKR